MSPLGMFNMYHTGPLQGCSGDLVGFIDCRRVVSCGISAFGCNLEDIICDSNLGRCRIFGHRIVILVTLLVVILLKSGECQSLAVGVFPVSLIQCEQNIRQNKTIICFHTLRELTVLPRARLLAFLISN